MRYRLFAAAVLFSPLKVLASSSACERDEIRTLNPVSCASSPFEYIENAKRLDGELIRLSFGMNGAECIGGRPYCSDYSEEKVQYFLKTATGDLVDLKEFPQQAGKEPSYNSSTVCLTKLLEGLPVNDMSLNTMSDFSWYQANRIARVRYELKGNSLVTHYDGAYPFEGAAQSTDGKVCTGDLKLKKEFVDWKQAAKSCDEIFHEQFEPDEPQYIKPARAMMSVDASGHYYICNITWQKPGSKWKMWYYRVDADPQNSKPLFLHVEAP